MKQPCRHEDAQVLYVEDDDCWADLVRNWLNKADLTLSWVSGKKEMASYLQKCKALPECVLMDLRLNDSDGLQLCNEIKSKPILQKIPIVVFTGLRDMRMQALDHSAVYFVTKSHQAERELVKAIQSILAQRERTLGVTTLGDLKLDPRDYSVCYESKFLTSLSPHLFSLLRRLMERFPYTVMDDELRQVATHFLYARKDPQLRCRTIDTYISQLRGQLGGTVGERIQRVTGTGYIYVDPKSTPAAQPE